MPIARLEPVPLRELWEHEERDFSAWLAENLDVLSEAIGFNLVDPQREVKTGSFEVDLVAEDEEGNRVVIENQLESTDHEHLGKLLTYMTNFEAKVAIWISSDPRPEHVRAMAWLNEMTPDDISFYLVRLAAYRIGDSPPAPLFTVIVGPSREAKDLQKDLAERHVLRLKFWEGLLARAKEKGVLLHASRSPSKESWLSAGAGKTGLALTYLVWLEDRTGIELSIDTGEKEENKRIFDTLWRKREEIEAAFGEPLIWERMDDKRACRVRYLIRLGGLKAGEAQWPVIQDAMITAMDRFAKVLKPILKTL